MKKGLCSSETPEVGNPGTQLNNPKDLSFEYNFVRISSSINVMSDGHSRKWNVSALPSNTKSFGGYFTRYEAIEA